MAKGPVTYYRHEESDGNHSVIDQVALCLAEYEGGRAALVVFPVGGPTFYTTVGQYDPDTSKTVGDAYWREQGAEPPDFSTIHDPVEEAPDADA